MKNATRDVRVRNVPDDLWQAAKVLAALERKPVKDIVIEALRARVEASKEAS